MKRRHAPVERYFGSSFGLRLQNIDAGMADAVVRDLAGQGISSLPIHDSFRVAARHEGAAREAMEKALETATNARFSRDLK